MEVTVWVVYYHDGHYSTREIQLKSWKPDVFAGLAAFAAALDAEGYAKLLNRGRFEV